MPVFSFPLDNNKKLFIKKTLLEGKIIIYPTETFYAIGCSALSSKAIKKIYTLKKRDTGKPLLVLVNSWKMLEVYIAAISYRQRELLEKHWPGPVTAIFEGVTGLASELNRDQSGIGFRMTSSSYAKEIISLTGIPLVGTSANISGGKEISEVAEAMKVFGKEIDLYINGGTSPGGLPSTVVNLKDPLNPVIVRQGAVKI